VLVALIGYSFFFVGFVDGFVFFEIVLILDSVDDVIGDGSRSAKSISDYLIFSPRISSWSTTSRFL
jgi:hypothetical protein